jgi:thymidylate synthase
MSVLVCGADVSRAWLAAVEHLLAQPGEQCSNLAVSIDDPTAEVVDLRLELDTFAEAEGRRGQAVPAIHSVAGTIFPSGLYRPAAKAPAEHLYEMERLIRHVVRKHKENKRGTYFERLVAYPLADGSEVNQLDRVLKKLQRAAELGQRNGNKFELATFHPGRDTNPRAFPCLSHISITLLEGRLDGTAVYRNQYFLARAYGNYLGLGEVLRFLANESGFALGELLCVSSHAYLEAQEHGRARVEELLQRCGAALMGDNT